LATASIEPCVKDGLALEPAEQAILESEIGAFAETLKDPVARQRYLDLAAATEAGIVPERFVVSLEAMLELVLQTQRVRRNHGPEAEHTLTDLFYRTPRGAGLRQAAREVSRALEALRGHTLENVSVMAGPGRHTLVFRTDQCQLTMKLDAVGARIDKVEVGG
jgi:hypothetical protein